MVDETRGGCVPLDAGIKKGSSAMLKRACVYYMEGQDSLKSTTKEHTNGVLERQLRSRSRTPMLHPTPKLIPSPQFGWVRTQARASCDSKFRS